MKKQKNIISFKKIKAEMNIKKFLRMLRIPIVVFVFIIALFLSFRLLGNVAVSNFTDAVRQIKVLFTKGEGFPCSLEDYDAREVLSIGNRIMVVDENATYTLNSKAGTLFECRTDFASAKVISNNGRALVYSPVSNTAILQSKTERLGEVKESGGILTAALAKNGAVATSCSTEDSESILSVYNNRFELEFRWNCSKERISAIALSDNGKRVALSAIGAKNAEIYSRFIIFNTKEQEAVADIRLNGTMIMKIVYTDNGAIIAVGDNKTIVYNSNGEQVAEYPYAEDRVAFIKSDYKGNTAVCITQFGGTQSTVSMFNNDGEKTCDIVIDGIPTDVEIYKNRIYTVQGSVVTKYSDKGEVKSTVQAKNTVSDLILCKTKVYTLENGSVYKY